MPKSVIFTRPSGRDQQVGRLDVAVHDARARARRAAPRAAWASTSQACGRRRARPSRARIADSGSPRHELHDEVRRALAAVDGLAVVEDGRDARVVHAAGVPGLGRGSGRRKAASSAYSARSTLTATGRPSTSSVRLPDLAHAADGDPRGQPVAARRRLVRRRRDRRLIGLITASMTALAIGAATRPPVASSGAAAVLDEHRDRDLRVVGRREEMNQAYGGCAGRGLRGAGLAGDLDARDLRALVPVPLVTTLDHHLRSAAAATAGVTAADGAAPGAVCVEPCRSGAWTSSTR